MKTQPQPIQRVAGGRYAKGVSGNPGGRAAMPAHIKEMLGRLTPRAVEIMRDTLESEDEKLRFMAAQEILNRSLGKPQQAVALDVRTNAADAHVAALQSLPALATQTAPPARPVLELERQPDDLVDVDPATGEGAPVPK